MDVENSALVSRWSHLILCSLYFLLVPGIRSTGASLAQCLVLPASEYDFHGKSRATGTNLVSAACEREENRSSSCKCNGCSGSVQTAGIFPSAPIYFEKRDSDDDEGVPHEDRESNSSGPESSHGISGWEHNVARGYEALLEASMHVRSEGADSDPDTRGTEIKYNVRASGSQIACPLEARGFLETAESLLILRSIRPSYKQFSWYPKDASSSPIQEEYLYRIQVSEIDQHLIVSWRPAYSDVYSSDLAEMVKASWTQSMDQVSSRPQAPTLKYITITAIENLQTIEIIKTAQSQISPQSKAYTVFKAPVFEYIIYDELDLWSALLGTSEIYAIQKMLNNYRHTFDDASIESIRVGLVGIESSTDQAKAMILITLERLPGSHLAEPLSAHPRVSIEFEREYVVLTSFIGKRDFDHTHGYRTFTPDLWPGSGWERSRIYGPGSLIPSYNQLQVSWRAVSQGPNLEKVGEGLCVFSISGIEENIVLQTRIETSHEILGDIIYDVWRRKRGQDSLRFITFMNLSSETETILRETYAKKIAKVERENSNSGNRGEPWKPYLTMWASRSSWEAHHLSDETSWSDEAIDSAAMDQLQDARELAAIAHILGNPFRWEGLGSPYIVSVDIGLRLWHGKTSYAMLVRLGSRFLDDEGDVVMAGAGPGMGESDSSDLTASAALADDDEPESDTVLYERERHTNLSIFIDALIIGTELRIKSRIGQQVSSQEGEDAGRAWERQQERYSMAIHSGGDKKPKSFRMPDQAKRLISGIAHQFEQEGVGPSILTTDLLNDESELYNLVYVCNKTNRSQIATSLYVSPQHGHLVILKSPEPDPQPQGVAKYVEIQFSSSLSLAWKGVIVHLPGDAPQPQPIKYITIINLSSWTKNYLRKMKSWYPDRTESVKLDASDSFRAEDSIEGTEFIRGWAHSESHAQNRRSFLVYLGLPEIAAIEEMTWREFRTPVTQARIIEKIRIIWGPEYPHDPQIFISLAEWPPMDLRRTKEADLCARIRGERQDIAKVAGQGMFLAELTAYVAPFAITHGLSMGNWAIAIKDDERIRQRASYLSDAEESLGPTRALQDILPMLNLSVSDINHPIELRGPSLNAEEDGSDRLVLQGLSSPFSRKGRGILIGRSRDTNQAIGLMEGPRKYMRDEGKSLDHRQQIMRQLYKAVFEHREWNYGGLSFICIHQVSPEAYHVVQQILSSIDPPTKCVDGTALTFDYLEKEGQYASLPLSDQYVIALLGVPELSALASLGMAAISEKVQTPKANPALWFLPKKIVVMCYDTNEIVFGVRLAYYTQSDGMIQRVDSLN